MKCFYTSKLQPKCIITMIGLLVALPQFFATFEKHVFSPSMSFDSKPLNSWFLYKITLKSKHDLHFTNFRNDFVLFAEMKSLGYNKKEEGETSETEDWNVNTMKSLVAVAQ